MGVSKIVELGFNNAIRKGGMSNHAIDMWHEKNSFLECQDDTGDGIVITYCMRVTHIWIKRSIGSMYDHYISQN